MNGWMDRCMHGQTGGWIDGAMDACIDGLVHGWMN